MNYFVVDTETTGLPQNGIWPKVLTISLVHGCIGPCGDFEIFFEKEWYISNWLSDANDDTLKFLQISRQTFKEKAQQFDIVKKEFLDYIENVNKTEPVAFVAHNANFDKKVLRNCGINLDKYKWYCTMLNGWVLLGKQKYPKLEELARHFNIEHDNTKLHNALYDAQICAHVFYCLITQCYNTKVLQSRILHLRNRQIIFDI